MQFRQAFTLVELSVVLVVLGLLVGGVMAGRELIRAAEIRAQLAQLDEIRLAATTFKVKYFYLPGDIPDPLATRFKLEPRNATYVSDGNGVVGNNENLQCSTIGEPNLFWVDLTTIGLLKGAFLRNTAALPNNFRAVGSAVGSYIPQAKISGGYYITLWSGGVYPSNPASGSSYNAGDSQHYFTLARTPQLAGSNYNPCSIRAPELRVSTAYNLDVKADDGMPMHGQIIAAYIHNRGKAFWAGDFGGWGYNLPHTKAVSGDASTCYDNNNMAGQPQRYSMAYGDGENCALTFKAQF